ncbi:hypothetical protein FRC09_005857 [Ceratobasidium sp. 395]|nr:hypothetical protein FRC09_005857 [Ceratobasidium sp. 395]
MPTPQFICCNPTCLRHFKDHGSFQQHLYYSNVGCTSSHFKSYKSYLAGLEQPTPKATTTPNTTLHTTHTHPSNVAYNSLPNTAYDSHCNNTNQLPNTSTWVDPHSQQDTSNENGPFFSLPTDTLLDPFGQPFDIPPDWFVDPSFSSFAPDYSQDPYGIPNLPPVIHADLSLPEPPPAPAPTANPGPPPTPTPPAAPFVGSIPGYHRVQTQSGFNYEHETGGRAFGEGKRRWEQVEEYMRSNYPGRPWGVWKDKQEWEIAQWMATKKVSQSDLDELLATELFQKSSLTFKTTKQLFGKIEKEMEQFGGPPWEIREFSMEEAPSENHLLVFRDLAKCGDHIMSHPDFAGQLITKPMIRRGPDDSTRIFREMSDGDDLNRIQNDPNIPEGTTLGGVILASDKTGLSMYSGDVVAHGLYMSLANIPKDGRAGNSRQAWMLVAYLPTSKWQKTLRENEGLSDTAKQELVGVLSRRLFHRSMSIVTRPLRRTIPHSLVDADGIIRQMLYILLAYIADLEEQLWIAGIGSLCCLHCLAQSVNLGEGTCRHTRSSVTIIQDIEKVLTKLNALNGQADLETPLKFLRESRKYGLCGVKWPFWIDIPGLDICKVLSMDLLHGFYKLFFDHFFNWNRMGIGAAELDARIASQIHLAGDRVFAQGVSRISQMTGKEHRDLLRTHVPAIAGAPNPWHSPVTRATRALVDCVYIARYKEMCELDLREYMKSYEQLHLLKQVWIDNKTRRSTPNKELMTHFNIPKFHVLRHLIEQVFGKGPLDNYSTETMERLHIEFIKWAYRASNRRDWLQQAIDWLLRHERIEGYRRYLRHQAQQAAQTRASERQGVSTTGEQIRVDQVENNAEITMPGQPDTTQPSQTQGSTLGKRGREGVVGETGEKRARNQVNGTSPNQFLTVDPAITSKPLAAIGKVLGEPSLLALIQAIPDITEEDYPLTPDTLCDLWQSIRIQAPLEPSADVQRIRAAKNIWSGTDDTAGPDPVLYTSPTEPSTLTPQTPIHGYSVGLLHTLFRPTPNPRFPNPPLLAYVLRFKKIPARRDIDTNLYIVKKDYASNGHQRGVLVPARCIIQLCPLSPVIKGAADRTITPETSLSHYDTFYINRYKTVEAHRMMRVTE